MDIAKREYNVVGLRAYLVWSFEFEAGFDDDQGYDVEYEFTVARSQGLYLVQKELINGCAFNAGTDSCVSAATLLGAVPSGFDFLGFALQGFEMRTNSGVAVFPGQVQLDASTYGNVFGNPTARKQTMSCYFIGLNGQGDFEPYSCWTRSVGVAFVLPWYNSLNQPHYASEQFAYSAANPVYAQTKTLPGGEVGIAAGLSSFDLTFASDFAAMKAASAGCFDPRLAYPNVLLDFEGSLFAPPPGQDFNADVKCMTGYLGP